MNAKLFKTKIGIALLGVVMMSGCMDFDEINTNPDRPLEATAPWLATNMITSITSSTIDVQKTFIEPYRQAKYVLWTERAEGQQYNNLGRADFNRLTTLRNIRPMLEYAEALGPDMYNSYKALSHFVRAWLFFQMTMRAGDIPYTEAIQGNEGLIKPKYDTQKEIFKGILDELDQANLLFERGATFSGDFVYSGNVDKWRRLTNSFQLYVLLNLHKKTSDAELNVAGKFREVAQRPLIRNLDDNFAITYNDTRNNCYPWSNTAVYLNPFTIYTMLSCTLLDMYIQNNDRRLFYVAEPAKALLDAGKSESDYDAYNGLEPSDNFDVTVGQKNTGMASDINKRYLESATPEPVGILCHWDVEFMLAEGAVRGWIADDAQTHYANGIKSSMGFYVRHTDTKYTHGVTMNQEYIDAYPATVELTGTVENRIKQIICQKYMAGFFHNGYITWFEFRRTGYPEFKLNPATNMNIADNTKFPTRWMYPQNEIDYNNENLNAAVQRQFNGSDDNNGVMWILKD